MASSSHGSLKFAFKTPTLLYLKTVGGGLGGWSQGAWLKVTDTMQTLLTENFIKGREEGMQSAPLERRKERKREERWEREERRCRHDLLRRGREGEGEGDRERREGREWREERGGPSPPLKGA